MRRCVALLVTLSAMAWTPWCFADPEFSQTSSAGLASEALQRHRALFTEDQWRRMDALNRGLREAADRMRRAESEAEQTQASRDRAELEVVFAKILEASPELIRIAALPEEGGVLPPLPPLDARGRRVGLLLRVGEGPGPVTFQVLRYDCSQHNGPRVPVPIAAEGVTWLLVGFEHVPHLKTNWELVLQAGGIPQTILPFTMSAGPTSRLNITIRSDATGRPAPAMVQLLWQEDGQEIRPANALDFTPQFDRQGSFTGPRRANYPGELAGGYWCVPGPFEMEVPAGTYEITVLRGVEHVAVRDTLEVAPGETLTRSYRPKRWINMARRGWYSGDDHIHGQILSDGDAENLLTWIEAEDVRLGNIVKMGDIHRTWFEQRGFGRDHRVQRGGHILVPGQECPRTHDQLGHTLHLNISHMIRNTSQYYLYDTVFDQVQADGGLSGYAHVNSGIFHVHRDMTLNIPKGKVDFVELLQFAELGTGLYYDFLNLGFKVTASAGSDVPWGGSVGEVRVYAHLGHQRFTADRWFEALDRGRTFVTNGVMLDLRVNRAYPGDELVLRNDRNLRVRAQAWGHPGRLLPDKIELVVNGEVVHTVNASPGEARLNLDFDLPPGNGGWIAARAEGSDGSRAHTTPVYAVRPPYRFWKLDEAEALIAKREESLDQIEHLVQEAMTRDAAGEIEDNRTLKEFARQGPALLERVEAARAYYLELRETAAREKSMMGQ